MFTEATTATPPTTSTTWNPPPGTMPTTVTTPTTGPTICPYGMQFVEMPTVQATPVDETKPITETTPVIVEVSPDAQDEVIVEITVTPVTDTTTILFPAPEDLTEVC